MEQLFRPLKGGLIVSLRGAKGGHILSREPRTSLLVRLSALEGPELADCVGGPEGYVCRKSGECHQRTLDGNQRQH